MNLKLLRLILLALILVSSLSAEIKIGTLNCYLLFAPGSDPGGQLTDKMLSPEAYTEKVTHLASLVKGLDFVGLEEIGSEVDTKNMAKAAGTYQPLFVQGKDTYTGEDVGALVLKRSGLTVKKASRVSSLENLSKHLLVTLDADGKRYAVLVVHLLRPIGKNELKHEAQLDSIRDWVESVKNSTPDTTIIVLGDFNNDGKKLLPLEDSAAVSDYVPTHLTGKVFDHIFTSGKLHDVEIVRPPLPKRSNDTLKSLWTDHFLVEASVH
ncbi:MAG TPA: hypothetical protein VL357_02515 [Rariglobus sp.]|jgi:endonuclease/exonuclease/phosphatase family metal-dependent hydrolase|nr:hypothetical protein [Rariglobus sp.]